MSVVGVSMGGPSALLFARQYPWRTKSLVMISAASHAIPPRPAFLAALFNVFLNDFLFWCMVRRSPAALLVALGVPAQVQKQLSNEEVERLHRFLESIIPMGARRNGQNLEQHMSEFASEQIKNIQAPTLILHAQDDTLVSFDQSAFAARNIPGAEFIPMNSGGHLAMLLNSNAGAKAKVLEFLERYNNH